MMKRLVYLFMIVSFASVQAQALQCEVSCSLMEQVKKVTQAPKPAKGHECCHGKNQNKEENKKKHHGCTDGGMGSCFHEGKDASHVDSAEVKITEKVILFTELPVLVEVKKPQIFSQYRPKIPNDEFLKFKARQNLYILKDQFLI
jgi:N-methylhydantoinase B/oxoprolinase/acetone carboxylase alpha subunit